VTTRNWVTFFATTLVLAACSGDGGLDSVTETSAPVATTTTTVTTTTTIPAPGITTRYDSVFDMREAVASGRFSCEPWTVRGGNEWATESAECGEDLVFAIYENASLIVDQREVRNNMLALLYDVTYDLTGPNWNVGCGDDRELCEELRTFLGGEIVETDLTES